MKRRYFLTASTLALAAGMPLIAAASRLKVGIIGGGIVGASIAFHLAEAGAEVILFEKATPGSGATEKSFAWVNAFSSDAQYRALRLKSMAAYRELDTRLQLGIIWGGYLSWAREGGDLDELRSNLSDFAGRPDEVRAITAEEFARLSPNSTPGSFEAAFFASRDGQADPVWVTYRFLDAAARYGARVIYPCEVISPLMNGQRLKGVRTTQGDFKLDRLVVAAGIDSPRVMEPFGFRLPMQHDPGILVHTMPMASITPIIHGGPKMLHFKQMSNGRIVGTDASTPPTTPAHTAIRSGPAEFTDGIREMHSRRILAKIATVLPAAKSASIHGLTLGLRPVPGDGMPVVGRLPEARDVCVAVTHSGVTLAPIIGRFVAQEMFGDPVGDLAQYRPERFSTTSTQYSDREVRFG